MTTSQRPLADLVLELEASSFLLPENRDLVATISAWIHSGQIHRIDEPTQLRIQQLHAAIFPGV